MLTRFCFAATVLLTLANFAIAAAKEEPKPADHAKIKAALLANYPLNTCVISGNPLTATSIDLFMDDRLVRICCPNCLTDFSTATDKDLAKLDKAVIAKQSPAYPLDQCPISGEKLNDHEDIINLVLANRLIKLCSTACVQNVKQNPTKTFAMLDSAVQAVKAEEDFNDKKRGDAEER